jgi:feruloyl esterase
VLLCKEGESPVAEIAAAPEITGELPMTGELPLSATAPVTAQVTDTVEVANTAPMTGTEEATGMPPMGMFGPSQPVATAACLTKAQVEAARKLYQGPVTEDGEALYPGHQAVGSELGWPGWVTGMAYGIGDGYLKYLAFPESPAPSYSVEDWTFDVAGFDSLREMGEVYNATNSDLSPFVERGGKLILYHGWADPAISPFGTLAYYQAVVDTAGGLDKAQEFARLFMVPGMFHCSGGNAPSSFDMLGPIQDWVEKGKAPEQIIATQYADSGSSGGFANPTAGGADQGEVVRTRPLCPFPLEQTYDGSGDVNDAASFSCATPSEESLTSGAYDWVGNDLFAPKTNP